jgi:hypothetical protein
MALERRTPIPVGRYWIDVIGENIPAFDAWARESPQVVIEASELFEDDEPRREWVLFRTTAPAAFENRLFGFPTIADESVKTSGDTVQRPDPETTEDQIAKLASVAKFGIGAALLIALLKVFRR